MAEMFASGRLVDLVLLVVLIEVGVLIAFWRKTGRGVRPSSLLPNLAAGVFLLIALRLALAGYGWMPIAACLAASGVAHAVDLKQRWRN